MAKSRQMSAAPSLAIASIAQRLAVLGHVRDALLRLGALRESDDVLALEIEQPFLVGDTAGLDLAATENLRDARGDFVVVAGDEAALLHVDEHHLERRDAGVAQDRDLRGRNRRTHRAIGQRSLRLLGDEEELAPAQHPQLPDLA